MTSSLTNAEKRYTRQDMVDAFVAGANAWHTTWDRHEQRQKDVDAERYVDRLEAAQEIAQEAQQEMEAKS